MLWLPEHWLMHSIYIHSFIPHIQLVRAYGLSRVLANESQHLKISRALMPAFMQFNFRRWMEGDFSSLPPGVLGEEMIVAGLQMIRFCLNNCIFYFHLYYRNITSLSYLPFHKHLLGEAGFMFYGSIINRPSGMVICTITKLVHNSSSDRDSSSHQEFRVLSRGQVLLVNVLLIFFLCSLPS